MDMTNVYKVMSEVQETVRHTNSLDEALQESLRVYVKRCGAESAVLWYVEQDGSQIVRPYFWIGASDLTSCSHKLGEGMVGRVCQNNTAERYLDFDRSQDPCVAADYPGVQISSVVCVPFTCGDAIEGCIQMIQKDGKHFDEEEADICEMLSLVCSMVIADDERFQPAWEPGKPVMQIRGVKREYVNGDEVTRVLKGVNLDVFEGEFLVLLGESGCGKSTLLNIIGGMDHPTEGSFEFFGDEMADASQKALTDYRRDNIGFIFQSYNLMPNLNAKQNLELIANLVDDPMDADEALEIVNLGERKHNYPSQMSGGQQQRVSIARALMKKPRIILADEPTAALDYTTSIEVLDVMEDIVNEGTTMIMVTHNEEICRMADRVVRVRDGRVDEVSINRNKAHAADLVW